MHIGLSLLLAASSITWSTANSVATGDQDGPAIAMNRNGGVAVVWEDDRDTDDAANNNHSEIYLRYFLNGISVYEVELSPGGTSGTDWKHLTPDVGLDDRGNAVVVWADDPDGNGYFNIPYRVVSPTGTILGSGQANADSTGDQIRPRVAVDPDGTSGSATAVAFTVVWEDVQTTAVTIRAAGYTGATTKAYEKTASQTTGTHHRPDVAVGASGDATVVWEEDADANAFSNIGLTRLARANGAVLLSARTANVNGGGQQTQPAIAADYNGDFTVGWVSDHTGTSGVWERSFTSAGTARHADVEVAAGGAAPAIGIDDQANVAVGWTVGGLDGWARGLNPDGTVTGRLPAQALTQTTTGRQDQLMLAESAWGEIAVAYTDDNDGNTFDQVLLGQGATNDDGGWQLF
ncbi:hypothetical protein [Paractinoplanes globisporus]|uniref:Uncharacterized protein n=1 Tax=Paractinoplanes globisporus TaxID=113565 RepID=A0ABW6WSU8_9ACTN|nr:hypothetical protein [Actinoplanes globisporus]